MVGRLVEQKQIGLTCQRAAQGNTAFFAARKWPNCNFKRRRSKRSGRRLDARVEVPSVGVIDQVQQLGKLCFAAISVFITTHGFNDVGRACRDVFMHAQFRIQLELLRQVADTQRASQSNVTGIGLVLPRENFQQRSFAASVAPHHADLFAGGDGKRHAIKQGLIPIGQPNLVGG